VFRVLSSEFARLNLQSNIGMPSQPKIILVRPRDPNNIGAAARAMKNFAFSNLWIVTPYPPVWNEVTSAVNATDVLANARLVGSLEEAVFDCHLVIGTADRTRLEHKQTLYTPLDLSAELRQADYQLALVYGSEKHGLTNEDLSHCHRVMSIPTQPDCPSMNLGQAVAVCCYELAREQTLSQIEVRPVETATAGAVEAALRLALDVLRLCDFVLPGNEPHLTRRLRSSLLRMRMTRADLEMLCSILSKIKRGLEK
jgi:tRNA/rRNA methyltransferase